MSFVFSLIKHFQVFGEDRGRVNMLFIIHLSTRVRGPPDRPGSTERGRKGHALLGGEGRGHGAATPTWPVVLR